MTPAMDAATTLRAVTNAFNQRDADGLAELFHPDVELRLISSSETIAGREAARQFYRDAFARRVRRGRVGERLRLRAATQRGLLLERRLPAIHHPSRGQLQTPLPAEATRPGPRLVRTSPLERRGCRDRSASLAPMRTGILTGGGDCPGLNAVIRAIARRALDRGDEVRGILHGWRGMVEGQSIPLGRRDISGLLPRGGTIIRTSRTNPYKIEAA